MNIKRKISCFRILFIIALFTLLLITVGLFVSAILKTQSMITEASSRVESIYSKDESQFSAVYNEIPEISDDLSVDEASQDHSYIESEPQEDELLHGWVINEYGYTYVYNDCGYEQFNYKTTALNRYVNTLNNLRKIIPDNLRVFTMIAPVSSTFAEIPREIYVSDNFFNQSQTSFEATYASKLDEGLISVPTVKKLEEKYDSNEQIFFRTDKNWTSLAAYYAYEEYCIAASISNYSLESYSRHEDLQYLGCFYAATESSLMLDNPDTFTVYSTLPSVKTALTVYDNDRIFTEYVLCENNASKFTAYNRYLGRDAGRYEISTTAEGGNLLVIGDSSVYPILPYLCSHYSKIDFINPEYFKQKLATFIKDRNYDDCLVMCYSTNAVSGNFVPYLSNLIGVNNE